MTFKDLFSRFSFAEIKLAFVTLWRGNSTQSAGHLDFLEWARIYQSIQRRVEQPLRPHDLFIGHGDGLYAKQGVTSRPGKHFRAYFG